MGYYFCLFCVIMGLTATSLAAASGSRGQVTFQGLPVPGATVTAIQGDRKFTAITNREGLYSFPDLTGGTWTIEVEMTGFSTLQREIVIAPNAHGEKWELKLLPLDQIKVASKSVPGSIQPMCWGSIQMSIGGTGSPHSYI
ncbi:MAG: carboxypeptidase-like regulatory domain-containing protein [Terriglobia bacterium]|nr:carboxypeptidase-like regulatory domain-containing protein [Terriglobia bacterium]